jgi:maltooligosyltrehalose trehalohydrolase
VPFGDRSQFFKLQPYAIALYTCEGTPMLWQGQEFAENYVLPASGKSRVCYQRNVNWEYFYDDFGAPLVRLYRVLGKLRQKYAALRSRESFYYAAESRVADQIVAYRRQSQAAKQVAIVVLNFGDTHQSIDLPFPETGTYREMIDEDIRKEPWTVTVHQANQSIHIDVPSHYGFVFVK